MATGQVTRAQGTIVLSLDLPVAPAGHTLTIMDLGPAANKCWRVVRIPVRFVVFTSFELPLILGVPFLAYMTEGMQWRDGQPGRLPLFDKPPPKDGTCRPDTEWQIPMRMLRPTTTQSLYVCCTEQDQWISTRELQQVRTRVISGAEMKDFGMFSDTHGWVREGTVGAHKIPLEYVLEGVQHYGALYSGERRFMTQGSIEPLTVTEEDTILVSVMGTPLEERRWRGSRRKQNRHRN